MGDAPGGLAQRSFGRSINGVPGTTLLIGASVAVVLAVLLALLRFLYRRRWPRRAKGAAGSSEPPSSLAHIQAEASAVPLVMLVNVRSGGGRGVDLLSACQKVPHPPEAFALSREGLADAVRRLAGLRSAGLQPRVVCAGGDGTVTAVVRTLLERGLAGVPVAVLPLGTGNDCARTLGSTAPQFDAESMSQWLRAARSGRCVHADVFSVAFDVWPGGSILSVRDKTEVQLAEATVRGTSVMYCSAGLDARLVYTVELHRRRSALLNKFVYFLAGLYNSLNVMGGPAPVSSRLASWYIDGAPLALRALPASFQSIIAQIVPSYGGGSNPWTSAWSFAPAVYRALYAAAHSAPIPRAFESAAGSGFSSPSSPVLGSAAATVAPGAAVLPRPGAGGEGAPTLQRWWDRLKQRGLAAVAGGRDPWPRQGLDDGALELMGARTLLQEAAAVGPRTAALGGLYRLAQARDVRRAFLHPKPVALGGVLLEEGPSSSSAPAFLLPPPQQLVFQGGGAAVVDVGAAAHAAVFGSPGGATDAPVPDKRSTRRALGAALGQVVRSTAGRLRPSLRGVRSAVLAPPEEREEEDDGVSSSSSASLRAQAGSEASSSDCQPSVSSPSRVGSSHHLRGYATVPHGFTPVVAARQRPLQVPGGSGDSTRAQSAAARVGAAASLVSRRDSEDIFQSGDAAAASNLLRSDVAPPSIASSDDPHAPSRQAVQSEQRTPTRGPKPEGTAAVSAALSSLTPSALFSRVSAFALRHRGGNSGVPSPADDGTGTNATDSSTAPQPAPAPASGDRSFTPRGAGNLLVVPMGGDFADTEPTFVQVDGEGYKVFALRRLELSFCARALMVTFK